MPWIIRMQGDQHCVYKKGADGEPTGKSLGCHDSHEKAVKQQKALYAAEAASQAVFTIHAFSDAEAKKIQAGEPIWVHATTFGDWSHPVYGDQTFDETRFERMLSNFESNVYGQDLPIRYEHFGMDSAKGFKAAGWVKDAEIRDNGLWYLVAFTQEAAQEINDGAWKYFSFEWYDYWENEKGVPYLDVLGGGALTNDPFRKGMVPLNVGAMSAIAVMPESEHADLEHSEPGTGSPPERRKDGDIQDDELHRREQVPPAFEEPENTKGGNMEEFLKKLREKLGLSDNATEEELLNLIGNVQGLSSNVAKTLGLGEDAKPEDITKAVSEMQAELQPLREADKEVQQRKAFRDAYPEEFARMQRLEETDQENKAKAFSGSYARFSILDKEGKAKEGEKSTRGFSALVLNDIEDAHKLISKGEFGISAFSSLLDHIARDGIVDYGEKGSAVTREGRATVSNDPEFNTRYAFSSLVKEIMEEDELSRRDAILEAARREPELYEQYRDPNATRAQ